MKKSVFLSAIKALYKKEEVDVADHLKTVEGDEVDDKLVETVLKQLDAEKVTTFKTEATTRFDNGVKKGQKDTAQKFEKKLREVFNVDDTTLEGDELLTHIEENLPEAGDGKGKADLTKFTEEELSKVPAFQKVVREHAKALKLKETEKDAAVQAEQAKQTQAGIKSEASAKALAMLDGKNPVLPKDAAKALMMKNKLLVDELKGYTFTKDGDTLIPVDADGKQLEDANGNPMNFDALVNGIMDANFEFTTVEKRDSPGNKGKGTPQQQQQEKKPWTGKAPANANEYTEMLLSEDFDTEAKVALKEQYSEQFSG